MCVCRVDATAFRTGGSPELHPLPCMSQQLQEERRITNQKLRSSIE